MFLECFLCFVEAGRSGLVRRESIAVRRDFWAFGLFISVGESCHNNVGRMYMEGVFLGCDVLGSDELILFMHGAYLQLPRIAGSE